MQKHGRRCSDPFLCRRTEERKGFYFECDMMLPQNIGISDTDLCKIYGNLLENAVDAVKELLPENKPYVKMLTKVKNKKLLIEISNPYSNEIQRREKVFIQQSMKALESELHL